MKSTGYKLPSQSELLELYPLLDKPGDTVLVIFNGALDQMKLEHPPDAKSITCLCIDRCTVNGLCPVHGDAAALREHRAALNK